MISCYGVPTQEEDSEGLDNVSGARPTYVDRDTFQQYADQIAQLQSTVQQQSLRINKLEAERSGVAPPDSAGTFSSRKETRQPTHGGRQRPQELGNTWDLEAQDAGQAPPFASVRSHKDIWNSASAVEDHHPVQTPHAKRAGATKKTVFDKDLVQTIYEKPYKRARNRGAMVGGGIIGLLSMPFGPIGMAAGSVLGATVGAATGFVIDWRTMTQKLHENEKEIRRLKSFLRWAQDRFHEDEEIIQLIEKVALEFKPMADIAVGSASARQMLRMLEKWVSQKKVNRNLWRYMEELLKEWKDLNRSDFLRSMTVFQILLTMYHYSNRTLSEQEAEFVNRMRTLLEHDSVKMVMAHAQNYPTSGETRVMECMVYADAHGAEMAGQRSLSTRNVPLFLSRRNPSQVFTGSTPGAHATGGVLQDEDDDDEPSGDEVDAAVANPPTGSSSLKASPRQVSEGEEGKDSQTLVLKKPFFKSWQDFMDFDLALKHQMSITLSEFALLHEKRDEPLKGWDLCVDRKEIKVAKVQSGEGNIMLRAWATLPGVDHLVAFFMFYDIQERMRWDKVFANMDIIEKNKQGADVLYSLLKMPGVTQRDFLQYRRVRVLEDGTLAIVMRSALHEKCPEDKRYIRAESYISGYLLQKEWEGKTPVLKLFIMTCTDVKGLIPKWIVNYMAPKKPAEWVESLRQAATSFQEKNPAYEKDLLAKLEEFKKENLWDYEPVAPPLEKMQSEREAPQGG